MMMHQDCLRKERHQQNKLLVEMQNLNMQMMLFLTIVEHILKS